MTRHSSRPAGHGLGGIGRSAVYIAGASLAVAYGLGGCTSSPLADGGTADAGPVESGRLDAGPPCMGAGEPRLLW